MIRVRASILVLFSLVACVRTSEPTTPPAAPPVAAAPVTTAEARTGWWCYTGRYPGAQRTSSRCMREESECNRWHADVESDGYQADTERCFRLDVAHCTEFPSGGELCRANAEHCEAARLVFSGRPGRPAEVPACEERT
jgi:hypothetical protein